MRSHSALKSFVMAFLSFLLISCGGSDGGGQGNTATSENPGDPTSDDTGSVPAPFKMIARSVSPNGGSHAAMIFDERGQDYIAFVGIANEDGYFTKPHAIEVGHPEGDFRVFMSYGGFPKAFQFDDGTVFLDNLRLDSGLVDFRIETVGGQVIIEQDIDITGLLRELIPDIQPDISRASSDSEKTSNSSLKNYYQESPEGSPLQALSSTNPSEQWRNMRTLAVAGLSIAEFGKCVAAVKAAAATGGATAGIGAIGPCEGSYQSIKQLITEGRITISDGDVVDCLNRDCKAVAASTVLRFMDNMISKFETLEAYRDSQEAALNEIDKYFEELNDRECETETCSQRLPERLRFLGILSPQVGKTIFGLSFDLEVRVSFLGNSNPDVFWNLTAVDGTGNLIGSLQKQADELIGSRWTTTVTGFGPGTYTLVIRAIRNEELETLYTQTVEIKAEQLISIYEINTSSRIIVNAEYDNTSTVTTIYSDADGNLKSRTDTNSFDSTTNFAVSATDYTDPLQRGYMSVEAPSFPSTITACKIEDAGDWIPKTVSKSGTVNGHAGRAGSGSTSGRFSISKSGGIEISMYSGGAFDGWTNAIHSYTLDAEQTFSISAAGQVKSRITSTYTADVEYGTSYNLNVSNYSKSGEDPLSLFSYTRREQLIDPNSIPSECY